MSKPSSGGKSRPRKAYSTPKLATHGDVRKLTQHPGKGHAYGHHKGGSGSDMFDWKRNGR